MLSKKKEFIFTLLLLLTAAVWGSTFVIIKDVQQVIPQCFVLAIRFSIAAVGLSYYVWQKRAQLDRNLIISGIITGVLLFTAFFVQTWGLSFTTASKNAILSQANVVFVPLLLWLLGREKMTIKTGFTVALCFLGILIISPPELTGVNKGDMISLLGGFFYGAHIVAVAICSRKVEIMPLTCLQFFFASICAWSMGLATSEFPTALPTSACVAMVWLSVVATLVAMTLMNLGIKYVSSTKTTIILSTESLFGCMFGIVVHNDPLTLPICIGFVVVMASVLLAQLGNKTNSSAQADMKAQVA